MSLFRTSPHFGTISAIYRTVRVAGFPDTTGNKQDKWGGARNGFLSASLSSKQVHAVHSAAESALIAGKPFNRFVTVHWTALGVHDSDAARMTGRLIKLASDWCATKGVKMTWAWVRENDAGDMSKGSHVHILLHCPADLAIGIMWRRWLRRLSGCKYQVGALASRSIGPTLETWKTNPALHSENLCAVLAYVCKGVDPAHAGHIIGKRAARWQGHRS